MKKLLLILLAGFALSGGVAFGMQGFNELELIKYILSNNAPSFTEEEVLNMQNETDKKIEKYSGDLEKEKKNIDKDKEKGEVCSNLGGCAEENDEFLFVSYTGKDKWTVVKRDINFRSLCLDNNKYGEVYLVICTKCSLRFSGDRDPRDFDFSDNKDDVVIERFEKFDLAQKCAEKLNKERKKAFLY
jgi:hypothetical protein